MAKRAPLVEAVGVGGGRDRAAVGNGYHRRTSRRARFMTSSISFEFVHIDFKHSVVVKRLTIAPVPV